MKTVLCYGDSNTHGTPPLANPADSARYDRATRWPGVMAGLLGEGWHVVEEGLPGRTTVFDDPIEGKHKNGRRPLQAILESHCPLDVVVLKLGTNDLKQRFRNPPADIAAGVNILVNLIRTTPYQSVPPKILLVCPPPIRLAGWLGVMFEDGVETSAKLPALYEAVAALNGCAFLDAGTLIEVSPVDGIHYEASQHAILARAIAETVRALALR